MTLSTITIHATQRKATNAARKAFGACRYGDVASVHRSDVTGFVRGPSLGYVVFSRGRDAALGFTDSVRAECGLLPHDKIAFYCTNHDSLKG